MLSGAQPSCSASTFLGTSAGAEIATDISSARRSSILSSISHDEITIGMSWLGSRSSQLPVTRRSMLWGQTRLPRSNPKHLIRATGQPAEFPLKSEVAPWQEVDGDLMQQCGEPHTLAPSRRLAHGVKPVRRGCPGAVSANCKDINFVAAKLGA